jgi:hypothetical protein
MRVASFSRNLMGSKRKWEVPSRHTVWEFDEDAPVGAEALSISRAPSRAGSLPTIAPASTQVEREIEGAGVFMYAHEASLRSCSGSSPLRSCFASSSESK